ncbi:hypothetical protein BGZ63DRAFT_228340 [Mariannaea sp. PMI_226]|nr:hypothetical protein BGZ63DRAFT_228340 [Mariannaea sp. PMI_226]
MLSMGILPALESRPRLVLPNTPPELISPGVSSCSSSLSSASSSSPAADQQPWISPPITSVSMSKYEKSMTTDMSADQIVEGGQSRPASSSQVAAPRQQLPSLSSLFGPPSAVRPLHSPVSDRPASYSATSPLDRPRAPSRDRPPPQASYFSQTLSPPASHPRTSYDHKFETERHPPHAVPRSFGGPESPRYRESGRDHPRPTSQADSHPAKWPAQQQDSSRHDFHAGPRDPPFRPPQDQFRLQFHGPKDRVAPSFPDQRPSHGGPNPPPTPTSTVTSDGLSSKDGLGPKIWTGTHFLPRFVRAAEVPGEGMCYFYDDGSHCKTVIDGEAVNAHWGVTKAGKPRKRLAIACVTCREKKIKCDPDYPRCLQCEKFGRVCKFKNAPRGGHNTSPSTPPAELDDSSKQGGPSRQTDLRGSGSEASSPVSPRTTLRQPSPDAGSHKRLRVGYDSYVPAEEAVTSVPLPEPIRTSYPVQHEVTEFPRIPEDVLSRAWATDPSLSDLPSIQNVTSQFFARLDSTRVIRFIPETQFKAWVSNQNHRKTPDDLMLLYSVLALGVALSGGPKSIAFEYAQVSHYAQLMTATVSLQLIQSKLLLYLYYLSVSRISDANEMISGAVVVMMALKLNVELQECEESNPTAYPFGISKTSYLESRRRTFWSLFMLERVNNHFPERPAMINAEDVYIRLPTDLHSFEHDIETSAPMFNPYVSKLPSSNDRELGISAYLVEIVHIWSTTISRIYRMSRRTSVHDWDSELQLQLHRLQARILDWYQKLPRRLLFSSSNLESAALAGELGPFLNIYLLYSHAMIKLNRHSAGAGRSASSSSSLNVQRCFEHSTKVLDVAKAILRLRENVQEVFGAVPPVMAMVVSEAVDVLTAGGRLSHLSDVIGDVRIALNIVEALGPVWEDSRAARDAIENRLGILRRIRDRGNQPPSPLENYLIVYSNEDRGSDNSLRWQIVKSMEHVYPKEWDNIYSLPA